MLEAENTDKKEGKMQRKRQMSEIQEVEEESDKSCQKQKVTWHDIMGKSEGEQKN
jgi:hypothetical protein